ncbi:hypothetical protein COCNU_scaffold004198G000010 [Cocos nucifera]|nr:hypothetical protein [Cocos nucifera]
MHREEERRPCAISPTACCHGPPPTAHRRATTARSGHATIGSRRAITAGSGPVRREEERRPCATSPAPLRVPPRRLRSMCHLTRSGRSHHRIGAPSPDPCSPGRLSAARVPPAVFHQPPPSVARCCSHARPLRAPLPESIPPPVTFLVGEEDGRATPLRISRTLPASTTADCPPARTASTRRDQPPAHRNRLHAPVRGC